MQFAKRAQVAPSATMTINGIAIQKRQQGEYIYNFATGDPSLLNHKVITDAAMAAVQTGRSPYPAVAGITELREIASKWMNEKHQTNYQLENTIVTCGGKYAVCAIVQALLNPGDEAILIAPYWVSYPGIVHLSEATPVVIETSEKGGWKVTPEEIKERISDRVKLLILNNGCNPTGVLYSKKELVAILEVCKAANVIVLSDEVYSDLVYDYNSYVSCGSLPEYQDYVVVVQSCSKIFAMAGWRVGFAFGPTKLIKVLATLQGQNTTGTSIQSQKAAYAAFQHADEVTKYVREEMYKRRELFIETYRDCFHKEFSKPPSAVYVFAPISDFGIHMWDSVTFCEKVLEEGNVALVPGEAFGKEGYVRFAFSEPETDIVDGLKTLSKVCKKFQQLQK